MLKTLLTTAAALTTLSLAHAADLPMTKAVPVEYVKICSEFGDGFYYIPGSDTCLSINGYVRADTWWFEPTSRADYGLSFRGRGRVNFDARTATEGGTLRSFLSLQYNYYNDVSSVNANAAFIQFGGWTAGYATSFYDFYDSEAGNTLYGTYFSSSATTHLLAYTAVFGDRLEASLSLEDNYYRRSGILSANDFLAPYFNLAQSDDSYAMYGGQRAPDVVASLRWIQNWGSAQIMAAAHQNRSDYSSSPYQLIPFGQIDNNSQWGFAVGAGAVINLPSGFSFAFEGNYARGAASYAGLGDGLFDNDVIDALPVDLNTGYMKLSRVWSVTADLGYNFTPSLTGHIVASYADYQAPIELVANFFVPSAGVDLGVPGVTDFDTWAVSANLTYTIVKGLTIAAEASYEQRDYKYGLLYFTDLLTVTYFSEPDYETWTAGMRLKRSF